jgi:hypothetical protein
MINLKKNNISTTSLVVERIGASDRNIILHFKETQLVGINFFQGDLVTETLIDHLDMRYDLYNFLYNAFINTDWWTNYEEFRFLHNSPDYWDILEWIDDAIWDYMYNIAIRIEELEIELKSLKKKY